MQTKGGSKNEILELATVLFVGLIWASCGCASEVLPTDLTGFWQQRYLSRGDSVRVTDFCELTDTLYGAWAEPVNYLPVRRYTLSNDSLYFTGIDRITGLELTAKELVGVVQNYDYASFYLIRVGNDTIHFTRTTKEEFHQLYGTAWLSL